MLMQEEAQAVDTEALVDRADATVKEPTEAELMAELEAALKT